MALLYNTVTTLYASPFLWNIESAQDQVIMNFNPYPNVHVNMSNIKKIYFKEYEILPRKGWSFDI
ncbi:hypothetical protein [Saccharolobus islandicus]|uniref:Uncharacterized protein n=1 Tax=Saccharolobus islandicus (strain M.16.4 / Kamchatka \|nr:hypothetical protein [Sulfolobus islandicus]ACR41057.1 hypothetical protein M164_0427 [Sulfolobus islandicus M.16.4]